MNATQSKQVLALLNEAIAMLPHEATLHLRVRLMQATAAPTAKGKCVLCRESIDKDETPVEGFLGRGLKPGLAHLRCGGTYQHNAIEFSAWCDAQRVKHTKHFDRVAMSYCACGGNADDHAKDELENLLKCSHCDTCEAFHYDVDEAEAA